jgi:hypothetical protein
MNTELITSTKDSLDEMYAEQLQKSGLKAWRSRLTVPEMLRLCADEGELEIPGHYNLNFAWTKRVASRLIESLMLDVFIPPIYARMMVDDGCPYRLIVDGKQRFLALTWFRLGGSPFDEDDEGDFRLWGCRRMPMLNGLRFCDFTEPMKMAFDNYDVGIITVEGPDDKVVSGHLNLLRQHPLP